MENERNCIVSNCSRFVAYLNRCYARRFKVTIYITLARNVIVLPFLRFCRIDRHMTNYTKKTVENYSKSSVSLEQINRLRFYV